LGFTLAEVTQKQRKKRNHLSEESGIYFIINVYTGKLYIGSAVSLEKRRKRHFRELRQNKHYNFHLQKSFNLYGEESFLFRKVTFCKRDELLKLEQDYINLLNACNDNYGYNIVKNTSSPMLGLTFSDEHRRKISESQKGEKSHLYGKTGHMCCNSKKVIQLTKDGTFIKEFSALSEAERQLGVAHNSISKVCRGKSKSAGGYLWRYVA